MHNLPQSAPIYFVWSSEQRVIVSLNSIKQLIFVMDMQCFYCAVGIKFLKIILNNFMPQTYSSSFADIFWKPHIFTTL